MARQVSLLDICLGGADDQQTSGRHCFPRIDGKVQDDLLDQAAIALNRRQLWRVTELHVDVLSQRAMEQHAQIGQDLV